MDDIYEYENSEYRVVSMQLKAIAYDVVTGISKKKTSLKKNGLNEAEVISDELATISDRIIELADSLEEEFQKLDQIEEKREVIEAEEKKSINKRTSGIVESKSTIKDIKEEIPKREDQTNNVEETKISDKIVIEGNQEMVPKAEEQQEKIKIELPNPEATKIEEKVNEEQKENNIENEHSVIPLPAFKNTNPEKEKESVINKNLEPTPIEEQKELSLPDLNIKTENVKDPVENVGKENKLTPSTVQQAPSEPTITLTRPEVNATVEIKEQPSEKKRFQKQTKNLSKAIMVRQNQLENLRKSRRYQEQLLMKQGIFEAKEIMEEEKNPIEGPKVLPDEVERQIEDLTVKANIYYNEGEADKAQELYNKIRELNEQYR